MEDGRPLIVSLLDSINGHTERLSTPPRDLALNALKRFYAQDFGDDAKAWLDYAIDNDNEFVKELERVYGVHPIEEYKDVLLDYENRSHIFRARWLLRTYRQTTQTQEMKTPTNVFVDLIFNTLAETKVIRQGFVDILGIGTDEVAQIEGQAIAEISKPYEMMNNDGLDPEIIFKRIYNKVIIRRDLAIKILMKSCKFSESEANEIAQKVLPTYTHLGGKLLDVTIDGRVFRTNVARGFFLITNKFGWIYAGDLAVGDKVRTPDGDVGMVEAITVIDET